MPRQALRQIMLPDLRQQMSPMFAADESRLNPSHAKGFREGEATSECPTPIDAEASTRKTDISELTTQHKRLCGVRTDCRPPPAGQVFDRLARAWMWPVPKLDWRTHPGPRACGRASPRCRRTSWAKRPRAFRRQMPLGAGRHFEGEQRAHRMPGCGGTRPRPPHVFADDRR